MSAKLHALQHECAIARKQIDDLQRACNIEIEQRLPVQPSDPGSGHGGAVQTTAMTAANAALIATTARVTALIAALP